VARSQIAAKDAERISISKEGKMAALERKVAVITGGASGIGLGTVELFIAEGARVVVADLQADKGKALEARFPGRLVFQNTDVSKEDEVKALMDRAVNEFGRIDCLFNNAGVSGPVRSITELSMQEYDHYMGILLRGVVLGIKYAGRTMLAQKSGSILTCGSTAALVPGADHIYNTAKAGVVMLTRSAALEFAAHGVRVNCICPGSIATAMFGTSAGLSREDADSLVDTVAKNIAARQPMKRAGKPDDVAQAALWFASDASNYVTGQVLAVDGGRTVGRMWPEGDLAHIVKDAIGMPR
jgi:NAD(P)-dependent dehydrogenase (short-subunit alcohol dehydrogenase family)